MLMKSFLDMVCRKKNDMKLVQMFSHEMLERLSDDSKKEVHVGGWGRCLCGEDLFALLKKLFGDILLLDVEVDYMNVGKNRIAYVNVNLYTALDDESDFECLYYVVI